jgi:hypothetical protein
MAWAGAAKIERAAAPAKAIFPALARSFLDN